MTGVPPLAPVENLHLLRSPHPGAKVLRRVGFFLVLFTLPTVLTLSGVFPEPKSRGDVMLILGISWMLIGIFGPILILWFGASRIGDYLAFFPRVRSSVGALMLLAGAGMAVLGGIAATNSSVQGRKGTPFVFAAALLFGGWRMLRGRRSGTPK